MSKTGEERWVGDPSFQLDLSGIGNPKVLLPGNMVIHQGRNNGYENEMGDLGA
jgi:hypothetical protein